MGSRHLPSGAPAGVLSDPLAFPQPQGPPSSALHSHACIVATVSQQVSASPHLCSRTVCLTPQGIMQSLPQELGCPVPWLPIPPLPGPSLHLLLVPCTPQSPDLGSNTACTFRQSLALPCRTGLSTALGLFRGASVVWRLPPQVLADAQWLLSLPQDGLSARLGSQDLWTLALCPSWTPGPQSSLP